MDTAVHSYHHFPLFGLHCRQLLFKVKSKAHMYDKELHTVVIFNTSTCSGCLPDRLTITLLE